MPFSSGKDARKKNIKAYGKPLGKRRRWENNIKIDLW
jgi:hypothetical protein